MPHPAEHPPSDPRPPREYAASRADARSSDRRSEDLVRRRLDALADELVADRSRPTDRPAEVEPTADLPGAPARTQDPPPGRHARVRLSRRARVAGWIGDRVPAGLRGRTHLGSAQVGLVSLVVAAGLLVGTWWFLSAGGADAGVAAPSRSSPAVAATEAADPGAAADSVVPDTATPAAVAKGEIVVDVIGKVRRPGIVVLPAGARVSDAVREAGGLRGRVDRTTLNLARPLTDGEQVVVGLAVSTSGLPPSSSPPSGGDLVDLNTADQAELETLPGVGPVTAAAILEWRQANGAFTAVEELLEVSGIGEATLAEIAPHVTL